MNVKALSEILGHKDVALTMNIYAHLIGNVMHDEASKLDGIFAQPETLVRQDNPPEAPKKRGRPPKQRKDETLER